VIGNTLLPIVTFAALNIFMVLAGYRLIKSKWIITAWLMLVVAVVAIHIIFLNQSPILRMFALIATTFTGMKVIALTRGYKNKPLTLTFTQWVVFASGWAGMRAEPFETLGQKSLPNAGSMIRFGISRVIIGLLLIGLAHLIITLSINPALSYFLITAILLVAMSLILHFGLLNISAGIWRLKGVNAYPLFRQPAKSINLTELWGKRWNIAFSEMTAIAIYRPVRDKYGNGTGLILAFAFSGLLHELALSLPVKTGYGLPMLYFMIQGIMVLIEKALANYNPYFLQNKIIAHAWVFFWIVLPMPLLFHTAFIKQVVWPLAGF
jgi:hypothetical protein